MPLLNSSRKFLVEALRSYSRNELEFAIIHAITATELLMKERLARIHPNLIYSSIDTQKIEREMTVSLAKLPDRLRNLDIPISTDDSDLIHEVRRWRNQILHHESTFSKQSAIAKLRRIFDFIARFLVAELGEDLKDFLPRDLYQLANDVMQEWQSVLTKARQAASDKGNVLSDLPCPSCGGFSVVTQRDESNAYCHLCQIDLLIGPCAFCGKEALTEPSVEAQEEEVYHYECLDHYARDYLAFLMED